MSMRNGRSCNLRQADIYCVDGSEKGAKRLIDPENSLPVKASQVGSHIQEALEYCRQSDYSESAQELGRKRADVIRDR